MSSVNVYFQLDNDEVVNQLKMKELQAFIPGVRIEIVEDPQRQGWEPLWFFSSSGHKISWSEFPEPFPANFKIRRENRILMCLFAKA